MAIRLFFFNFYLNTTVDLKKKVSNSTGIRMYDIVCEVLFKEVKFVFGRIGTVYPDVASPEGNKAWGQPESYITPDTAEIIQKVYFS